MSSLAELLDRGRPLPQGLEVDQVLAALHDRFGTGDQRSVRVGRYRVEGRLGSGGLGLVYRGHDPTLDRPVAIKVLKPGRAGAEHDARLLREAQVLARIHHPHVVEAFDVGFFEDHGLSRFFVAMELVEGTDLRRWLERPRPPLATLRIFVAAAEGLAAAHAAGLLHRDFKPSNVLVGEDGTVKVADFGLAAFTHELAVEGDTITGSVASGVATPSWGPGGTPCYMAPEQHRGEPLTGACDQYGLCVSLFEALYGRRPFEGEDHATLLAAKERGVALARPTAIDARQWAGLRRVLRRGLAPSPSDRFADMDALRSELLAVVEASRRRWVAPAALAIAIAAAGGGALVLGRGPAPAEAPGACAPLPTAATEGAPPRRGALARRLDASPGLAEAWPALADALDGYAAELRRRWDASCVLPPAERQEVQACLTRSADGLAALRELFAEGDPEVLAQGWSLVPELLDLQACRAHPTDAGREVEALRRATTARATLLATAGRLDAAREVLEELHAELLERGAARAVRLVEIDQAELLLIEGRYEDARAQLEALHFAAAAEGDAYGAGRSAVKLIAEAYRMSDVDQALHWARVARPLLERMQPRDADLEAVLEHNVALAHFAAGQLPEALARIRRAIERASAPGVEPSLLTGSQQVEAELLLHAGRPAEALAIHRTFLHGGDASAPRDVLATVVDLQSLGNALITLHELEDAHAAYLRSYELASSALGSEHPTTSAVCLSLARSEGDRGRVAEGQRLLASCLPELERRLGEEHPHVAVARAMGGRLASQAGEHERARTILRESLASLEQAFGEEHFVVADLWHELGVARAAAGDTAEARLALERALEFRRRDLPQGHVGTAESLAELARVELAAGAREQARVHLEEALEVFEQRQLAPAYVAQWRSQLDAMEAPP